jgi:guanylate kinase
MEGVDGSMMPLIVFIGQSGSGKTMSCNYLEKKYGIKQIRTYTTRERRDANDDSHIWADIKDYEYAKKHLHIIAETKFGGETYWTLQSQIDGTRQSLVVDNNGLKELYHTDFPMVVIFVNAEYDKRLDNVYTEIADDAKKRGTYFQPNIYARAKERLERDAGFDVIKCDYMVDANCAKDELCKRVESIIQNYI